LAAPPVPAPLSRESIPARAAGGGSNPRKSAGCTA